MDLFGVGSTLGAIGNTIIGGLNYAAQKKTNEKNLALQREQFEYQKALQQEIFNREDSAVQRKVQDLVKSGLNPLLASGGGASAGSSVGMVQMGGQTAPQLNMDLQGSVDSIYNSLKTKQDIATSKIQRALIGTQIASEAAKAQNIAQQTKNLQQEIREKTYNYNLYKGYNLPVGFTANNPYSASQGAMFMLQNAEEAVKKADSVEEQIINAIDEHNPGAKKKYYETKERLNSHNNDIWMNYPMP